MQTINGSLTKSVITTIATAAAALTMFVQAESVLANPQKPASQKRGENISVWRISYFPGQVSAASTVYLSKDAIKIATEGSYEIVAREPTWNAIVTNKKNKRSCELTPQKWRKEGFFLDPPDAKEYMNPKQANTSEKINFRGLQSRKRIWVTIESDAFYRYRADPQKCLIELISTEGAIPCSQMQREILASWYGIPNLEGVPLFWENRMKNSSSLRLKVANVERVNVPSEIFLPMNGTQKEVSMMKLVDNKYKTAITDFIEYDIEQASEKQSKGKKQTDK